MKSDTIGEIAKALSQAQAIITDVTKDKQGYNYNYADLSQVLTIVREVLPRFELSYTQLAGDKVDANGCEWATVETILMHSSGEWISSSLSMPIEVGKGNTKAQATGSVISYARRYAIAAIVGITQADDDAALHRYTSSAQNKVAHKEKIADDRKVIVDPAKEIQELCKAQGKTTNDFLNWATQVQKRDISSFDDLSDDELQMFAKKLGAKK